MAKYLTLTKDLGRLTTAQRAFYEHNGYLLIPKLVPHSILDHCSQRYDDIASGKLPKGEMTVMKDVKDRKTVNKIQDLNFDPVFCEYIECPKLLDIVECFTGPNIMAVHTMLIAKPPDSGFGTSRHPPHQDLYYFPFRPADKIVAAWTAMEKCDVENGCLYISPGSHKAYDLQPHKYPEGTGPDSFNKLYHGVQNLSDTVPFVNVEMEPGDTVFFHPLIIHGSGVNVSKRTRKAISSHYAAAECHYIEVDGTVQQPIKDEVLEIARKRVGSDIEISFSDVWRYKSSLVRGMRSSL